ncbi:MAG: hypothetical protein WA882_12280 [Geitlerinemataceae cyanobacterium]
MNDRQTSFDRVVPSGESPMALCSRRRQLFINIIQKRVKPGTGSSLEFLDRRTWIYPVSDIQSIIKKTPFVIVGGIATRLYMPERMTLDLDILVKAEDRDKVYRELNLAGSQRVGELSIQGSQWDLPDGTSLYVLEFSEDWVSDAVASPNYAPNGLSINALPYLILMKLQASRSQDLADVSRMLGGAKEFDLQEVRKVVRVYFPDAAEDLESLIALGKLERGE